MSYTPTTWVDGETQLSAENLNHIENQLGAIGTVRSVAHASAQISSNSSQNLCSVSLTAGTWIIRGQVGFDTNGIGTRGAAITTATNVQSNAAGTVMVEGSSAGRVSLMPVVIVTLTATTTYNLNAYQNSGATIDGYYNMTAVRIA